MLRKVFGIERDFQCLRVKNFTMKIGKIFSFVLVLFADVFGIIPCSENNKNDGIVLQCLMY